MTTPSTVTTARSETAPCTVTTASSETTPRSDRGSASLWLLAVGALIVTVASVLAMTGVATVARHRAGAAADLAALTAAGLVSAGERAACSKAKEVTSANGARLVSCQFDGEEVVVRTSVTGSGLVKARGSARGVARAGPVP